MQANSIKRYEIDWSVFRQRAFVEAGTARTAEATYDAIRFAVQELGDNHSSFRAPSGQGQGQPPPSPSARHLGEGIGYVSVPWFTGGGDEANALASDYHRLIEGVDTLGICGWVVDLRGNTGGNMWPMIAGVGPIVGEGILGFFVDPDSVVITWTYEGGASRGEGGILTQATDPYDLLAPDPPVVVLTDGRTASSGEATTIAFRGPSESRSFGSPTRGVSTANASFQLSDGALLILTVVTMADRSGRLYGEEVIPDELVEGEKTGDPVSDQPLTNGMQWLLSQPACEAAISLPGDSESASAHVSSRSRQQRGGSPTGRQVHGPRRIHRAFARRCRRPRAPRPRVSP